MTKADQLIAEGDAAAAKGDWGAARASYHSAAQADSRNAQAQYKFAHAGWQLLPAEFEAELTSSEEDVVGFLRQVFPGRSMRELMRSASVDESQHLKKPPPLFGRTKFQLLQGKYALAQSHAMGSARLFAQAANKALQIDPGLAEAKALLDDMEHMFPGIVAKAQKKGCFVATAVYGSPIAHEVQVMRDYRDTVLLRTCCGRAFGWAYERIGPYLAEAIAERPLAKKVIRTSLIRPLLWCLARRRVKP